MKTNRKEGFTLAELLVVVGIIGILVAVSIPIFASNKTEAELTTCQANRRALRAEMVVEYLAETYASMDAAFTAIYGAHSDEYVCPNKGNFSWESTGEETGKVKCSHHDGGGGGGNPDEPGPNPDEPGGDVLPGTNLPLVESYWPKQSDWDGKEDSYITVPPGGVFEYDSKYYIVCGQVVLTKSEAASGPGGISFSQQGTVEIDSKNTVEFLGTEGKTVGKGTLYTSDGKYFVTTHSSWVQSPLINLTGWYFIPQR